MLGASLEKNRLLLLPFFIGLALLIYSWYLTYPVYTISANDYVFHHVSILYWLSLPLLLGSMFLIAITTKSNFLKWILSIGIVLTFFSLYYFYSMMPTVDSQYFRGLIEYFIKTKNLDASQLNHQYYEWPAYFVLADILTLVSGLSIASYQFLLFAIICIMLATVLHVYTSKRNMAGIITVTAFFISLVYFLDLQAVPFSLALALLFLVFMLETQQKNTAVIVSMIVLYVALLLTHLFVPLFFVLYLLVRGLIEKNKQTRNQYRNFFLLALVSYFLLQLTMAKFSFEQVVVGILYTPTDYSSIASATVSTLPNSTDIIAQFFSRTVVVATIITGIVGLVFMLIKRKTNTLDKAILLAGIAYSGLGIVLNTIGFRALALVFIPISLGAAFLFKGKLKPFLAGLFLVLLILFLFVPLHTSFATQVTFQTREAYVAENFFLNHFHWESSSFVVTDFWTASYLTTKTSSYEYIYTTLNTGARPDVVLWTPQMVSSGLANYSSMQSLSEGERLNLVYNDGNSYVLTKSS